MKKILITGAGSYIGTSFEKYMANLDGYFIDTVDMVDGSWREKDFSSYDVIFHVAGIAHSDTKRAGDDVKEKYYKINTELTAETAQKAKNEGVGQFIFMSSMIVFGTKNACITKDTAPNPDNFYGDSKLRADIRIHKMKCDTFNVVSIRPPMIYGKGSKGNYPLLAKFAKHTPIFPDINNKRSMLYIENLCEFVKLMIDNNESGYFYPQNSEYVNTGDMVSAIAGVCGKKVILTRLFNTIIQILRNHPIIKKVFGDMYYEKNMSIYKDSYNVVDFGESIMRTEKVDYDE